MVTDFRNYLRERGIADGLISILMDITEVSTKIAEAMRIEKKGYAGGENIHGEKQLTMDVLANDLFVSTLKKNKYVSLIASEEQEKAIEGIAEKGYSVAFDPLDGSSLADVNLSVGSIIGIYDGNSFIGKKGRQQIAAMVVVYGPRLTLMVSVGSGVDEFTYDEQNFILTTSDLKLSTEAKMFAPGNLRASSSEEWYLELLQYWVKNGYTLRYSGGMVPDVNQILKKSGGVFTYPGYKEQPLGKLRLLYECAPVAFLIEQAGGKAVTGDGPILDVPIENLHQKTPIFLGSAKEVDVALSYKKMKDPHF